MEEARSHSSGIRCSVCGEPLQPFDRVCGGCGANVNACRSCGQRLLAGDRFCPSCGMTAEPGAVTARTSRVSNGATTEVPILSPWTGIFERLQSATLGEFHVIRELGRGGMAAVFLAHDVQLDRKVALKVMSPMLATDKAMVDRFRREAKTGASLKHPNIGTVYRVLEGEGLHFFVMDFVRGRPLDMIIRRNGVLSIPAVRALLYQIGSGLAYAHRRRIFHRDVKPGNVLVSAVDGTAVVTDFGIAKVAESPNQTQTGAVVGTPAYMAPEQILGREIDAGVDQYALGVMAYEMLTGTPPFVGTNFVVMHAHTEAQPRSIRDSRPDCPAELDDAVMRMLAKEPSERWPTLPHALAAMGATFNGEDDPIREELIRLATPDDSEAARFSTNTPPSPVPPHTSRWDSVTSVIVYPPPAAIEVGDTFRLTASPRDSGGSVVAEAPIVWSSSDTSIVSIQSDGMVSAHAVGSADIVATAGRARGTITLNVVPSRVVSLQLSIPPGVLVAGDRIQLAARAVDKHQRPLAQSVRWGVADKKIARVSAEGVLEARSPGTVEVFAEANGIRTGARVQVASPAVETLSLSFEPAEPVVGDRIYVTPTALDSEGHPLRDRAIVWSINDRSLVKVVTDGAYDAVADGTLQVTVTSEGKTATVEIPIAAAAVAVVRIAQAPQQAVVGATFKLTGTAHDARGNVLPDRHIEWSLADPSIGTITETGTITATSTGELRVIATCEGKIAKLPISIHRPAIGAVRISGVPQVVYTKMPFRLAATIVDGWGKQVQRVVEWRSSNVSIVSVAPSGEATASAVGHVRISAVVEGVESAVEIDVIEPPLPKVVVVPVSASGVRPIPDFSSATAVTETIPLMSALSGDEDDLPIELRPTEPLGLDAVAQRRRRGRRVLIGAGVAIVAVAGVGGAMLVRQSHASLKQIVATTEANPGEQAGQLATKPQESVAQSPVATKTNPNQVAAADDSVSKDAALAASAANDGVKVSIVPQAPLRVGEMATMYADVENGSTADPKPHLRWSSSKPGVIRIDARTGQISAVAPGQSTIHASAGGSKSEVVVNVIPLLSMASAPAPTQDPVRQAAPAATEPDTRAKGLNVLRRAADRMVDALQSKNVSVATDLFGEGLNEDATDLMHTMKDQFGFAISGVQIGAPQLGSTTGSIDYKVTVSWVSAAGPTRTRKLSLRAEAEQRGDGWAITGHKILTGWR